MRNNHHPRERGLLSENRDQELSPDDDDEDAINIIYTARRTRSNQDIHRHTSARVAKDPRASGFSAFLSVGLGWRKPKSEQITTAPGQLGAGETETEADEPPRHLPTTRILPASEPLVPPSTLTTLLFEASRLLSVVPASLGALINAWCVWKPPGLYSEHPAPGYPRINREPGSWGRITLPDRADYFLAVLWALLTAHQCLQLTTGLLHRWRAYYAPLSTLIRLLALQAICWPATHFTLEILGGLGFNVEVASSTLSILDSTLLRWTTIRPDVCWAVIGTTTCISRSIQIWVTSNLLPSDAASRASAVPDRLRPHVKLKGEETRKLVGRRWDWGIVARVCILPAACLYFFMAWVGAWKRETWGC
ncbi:hypothetical protein DFH29DRAFT_812922 [Suillus ampliporus]|nr:hypothetical protein DFH29DRAFT_812922 [Suillus ampliporus]